MIVGSAVSSGEPVIHAGTFDQTAAVLRSDVLVLYRLRPDEIGEFAVCGRVLPVIFGRRTIFIAHCEIVVE